MISRPPLDKLAADADVALCLECARENGDLVSGRKGVADVEIVLTGRAAHAGIEPDRGANAALAAAHLTVALQRLNVWWPDVTVNVGVLRAGERPNIVADQAHLLADLRASSPANFDAALAAIRKLATMSYVDGVTAAVENPRPHSPVGGHPGFLLEALDLAADDVGMPVLHTTTGGSADANHFAATGLPVLDGLGPIGGGDHSAAEWLDVSSVPQRIALLSALIRRLC